MILLPSGVINDDDSVKTYKPWSAGKQRYGLWRLNAYGGGWRRLMAACMAV